MHRAHHREPFIGRAFRRDPLADFVIENLRATPGQAIQARVFQTLHDRSVIKSGDQVNVVNLRW